MAKRGRNKNRTKERKAKQRKRVLEPKAKTKSPRRRIGMTGHHSGPMALGLAVSALIAQGMLMPQKIISGSTTGAEAHD